MEPDRRAGLGWRHRRCSTLRHLHRKPEQRRLDLRACLSAIQSRRPGILAMAQFPYRPAIHALDQIRRGHHEYRRYGEKRQRQQYVLCIYLDDVLIHPATRRSSGGFSRSWPAMNDKIGCYNLRNVLFAERFGSIQLCEEHVVKIRDIEVFQVQWAPEDIPAQRSAWVRVHCDDGSFGIGEASPMQGGLASLGIVKHNLAPALIRKDPLDHAVLLDTLLHTF